jgi:hypothetical protein
VREFPARATRRCNRGPVAPRDEETRQQNFIDSISMDINSAENVDAAQAQPRRFWLVAIGPLPARIHPSRFAYGGPESDTFVDDLDYVGMLELWRRFLWWGVELG